MTKLLYRVEHANGVGPYSGSYPIDDDPAWGCHEWLTWHHGRNPVGYPDPELDFRRSGKSEVYAVVTDRSNHELGDRVWVCGFDSLQQVAAWFDSVCVKQLSASNFHLVQIELVDEAAEGVHWAAAARQAIMRIEAIAGRQVLDWDEVRALHAQAS